MVMDFQVLPAQMRLTTSGLPMVCPAARVRSHCSVEALMNVLLNTFSITDPKVRLVREEQAEKASGLIDMALGRFTLVSAMQ